MFLKDKGQIMINGDLNAKTDDLDDTIVPDKFDAELELNFDKPPPKRNSHDTSINARGTEILDMCKSLNINIVNGRKTGDIFGEYTCVKWNGNSVVDYLLTSASAFQKILYFKVGDFLPWLSDHCPLHFTLELSNNIQSPNMQDKAPMERAPKQFVWTEKGRQKFLEILSSQSSQHKLRNSSQLDYSSPNNAITHITDSLIKFAENAKIKPVKKYGSHDPPWFDRSCKKLKEGIRMLGKNIKRQPKNELFKSELG